MDPERSIFPPGKYRRKEVPALSINSNSSSAASGTYTPTKKSCGKRINKLLFFSDMPFVTSSLGGLSRGIKDVVKHHLEVLEKLDLVVAGTQLLTIWTLPLDVYGLVKSIGGVISADVSEVRNDKALDLMGKVVHIADGIGNLTAGLVDIGAVATQAMSWAGPLSLGCSLAGVVFYVINGKALYKNRKFVRLFNKASQIGSADVLKFVKNKKHRYRIEKHGGVNVEKFTKKIKSIQKKDSADQDQKIQKAYEALKTRIQWKQASHALGILITTIGIVASIVFAVSNAPAFLIAGSSLLIGLYAVLIGKMFMEYLANRQFNHAMRLK